MNKEKSDLHFVLYGFICPQSEIIQTWRPNLCSMFGGKGRNPEIFQGQEEFEPGLLTTIPFSHNPIFGNEKSQPIPTSGILFLNQFPKMGLKFSTNSQCGKVKFNQFPVSNGNFFFQPIPSLIVL